MNPETARRLRASRLVFGGALILLGCGPGSTRSTRSTKLAGAAASPEPNIAVFRPSDATWLFESGGGQVPSAMPGDVPVEGDFIGNGTTQVAVFRPGNGTWYFESGIAPVQWGSRGDIPIPGDFVGFGKTQLAIFRPSDATWYFQLSGATIQWGNVPIPGVPNDIPIVADFNGSKIDQIAVFRPSKGIWYFQSSGAQIQWGGNGDVPFAADFNGSGRAQLAVFRPSNGTWYFQSDGHQVQWGSSTDIPVVGDFYGLGHAEIAFFHPSDGTWHFQSTSAVVSLGQTGDIPIGPFGPLTPQTLCTNCLRIRVGAPVVVRKQNPSQLDSPFSYVNLPKGGGVRGFITGWNPLAPGQTAAQWQPRAYSSSIDAATLSGFWGSSESTIDTPQLGTYSDCGAWMYQVERLNAGAPVLVANVHNEMRDGICNPGEQQALYGGNTSITYGTGSIAVSNDDGVTWTTLGPILTNQETPFVLPSPAAPVNKGEAFGLNNCGMVDGHDGFMYAYCNSFSHYGSIVARAQLDAARNAASLGPGHWVQWDDVYQSWSQPGLKGAGTIVGNPITGGNTLSIGSFWVDQNVVLGFMDGCGSCEHVSSAGQNGIQFSVSRDRVHFDPLLEPLVPVDVEGDGTAETLPTETTMYSLLISDGTSGTESNNVAGQHAYLAYTYFAGGDSVDDSTNRYLVYQDVWLTPGTQTIVGPQVGVALSNWTKGGYVRSTSGVVFADLGWTNSRLVGWLLTNASGGTGNFFPPTIKLEECVSLGNSYDYITAVDGSCTGTKGYRRVRTAGFTFASQKPNTLPLYRCLLDNTGTHFLTTSSSECTYHGHAPEAMLGYLMTSSY